MRRLLIGAALGATLFAVPATASAAPSDKGACRQLVQDLTVAASTEGTRGDFVSDVFFGNEPNVIGGVGGPSEQEPGTAAGRVVPSQSPGPKVTDPNTGEVGPGLTFGEFQQLVKAFCDN
jgi:hypothetical protein